MPFASLKEVYGDDFVTTIQQNTQQPNFQYKSLYNGKLDELETSPETENINQEIESFVSDYSNGLESYENSEPYEEDDEDIIESFEDQTTKDINCGHLLEHLAKCPKCRLYLEKHFGKQDNAEEYLRKKKRRSIFRYSNLYSNWYFYSFSFRYFC